MNVLLHEIQKTSLRAAELTSQLLTFSRKKILKKEYVDINAVINDMKSMLVRLIGEHITLQSDLEKEIPCILADPTQIQQVIINLVVNARDAMPNGGHITIENQQDSWRGLRYRNGSGGKPDVRADESPLILVQVSRQSYYPIFSNHFTRPKVQAGGRVLAWPLFTQLFSKATDSFLLTAQLEKAAHLRLSFLHMMNQGSRSIQLRKRLKI